MSVVPRFVPWIGWPQELGAHVKVVEVNLDKRPHNLRMRLSDAYRDGKMRWRPSMTLTWLPGTEEARAWNELSSTQQTTAQQAERKALLEQADIRGL